MFSIVFSYVSSILLGVLIGKAILLKITVPLQWHRD